ncbi:transposable element Tcb1 transposase [Trichonephila clavipes]|nr:transposable element Tcb1 transposase [Trichonephila clavipes]
MSIHWCAKIKDEVKTLAYKLNEEAERTERPIRRLSKVMYGSTCADMQVDVMGKCLSSIKHVVGEQLSGGSVVVVHEEPHPQMTGTLSYRPEETGSRQREKSLDTRHRRLDDRYRVLPWPEDCTVVVCLHDALYDESRFSLSSDSHRILIWRERGSRNHPSNIIERDRGAMGLQFLFMDDNAPCHRTAAAKQLLESEHIERMDWLARSPDLNPIEHVWDFLGRRLAARTLPPVTIRELRLALQDEWASMPQQLIDTLILSLGRRCETCLAVRGDIISLTKDRMFLAGHPSQECFGLQSPCGSCYFFNQASFYPSDFSFTRATKVARLNETFPQAELRRLKQAEREAAHRAAETPLQSQAGINIKSLKTSISFKLYSLIFNSPVRRTGIPASIILIEGYI